LQLAVSAQAVYGPSFDAYRYLKRFFAFEYRLPEPDHRAYAQLLAGESVLAKRKLNFCSALPEAVTPSMDVLARDFAVVANALKLDLRSQKQVFRLAEAACSGLQDGMNLYCLYMFFLAGAFQNGAVTFDSLLKSFPAALDKLVTEPATFPYTFHDGQGRQTSKSVSFRDLVLKYHSLSTKTADELSRIAEETNTEEYPDKLTWAVINEFRTGSHKKGAKSSLGSYYGLMRAGGQIGLADRDKA